MSIITIVLYEYLFNVPTKLHLLIVSLTTIPSNDYTIYLQNESYFHSITSEVHLTKTLLRDLSHILTFYELKRSS